MPVSPTGRTVALLAAVLAWTTRERPMAIRIPVTIIALGFAALGILLRPNALFAIPVLAIYILWPMAFRMKRSTLAYIPLAIAFYALVPLEGSERQDGRRTYVHVDGLTEPVVASRSERAILADVETALAEAAGLPRRRRVAAGQETLLP